MPGDKHVVGSASSVVLPLASLRLALPLVVAEGFSTVTADRYNETALPMP